MRDLNAVEQDLLYRIKNKPELQPFFFRKAKGLHWFDPLNEAGFFKPEENPKPVPAKEENFINIPLWPATEYLVTIAPELSSPDNEDYAIKSLQIIRDVTSHAMVNAYSNFRTWWQFSKVLRFLPAKLIRNEDLNLIDYWLDDQYEFGLVAEELGEKWLPTLLEGNAHSIEIGLIFIEKLFSAKFTAEDSQSHMKKPVVFRFDSSRAKRIVEKVAPLSGKLIGLNVVKIFESELVKVIEKLKKDSWSYIWRGAIEDHAQNHGFDYAENILITAYRDSLLGAIDHNESSVIEYLTHLIESPYQTLRRVAIYIADREFLRLKDLIDRVIVTEHFSNNLRHEVWNLLNHHFSEFHPSQKTKVLEIIESLKIYDDKGILEEGPTAFARSVWLSAIKDDNPEAISLYQNYVGVTETEPEHPDFASYMSVGWVRNESPFPAGELLALPIKELVEKMDSYKDPGFFDGPGLEGLVKAFKEVVKSRANEFYPELDKFLNLDLAFVYEVISAYHELWTENSAIQWKDIWPKLLDYCGKIVNNETFWSEESLKEQKRFVANRHWIVGSIAKLIESGTKSDNHAFETSLMSRAKEILLILLTRQKGEKFKIESDAVFTAINSPRGHCIEAMINHSLRSCRLADQEKKNHTSTWQEYESIYNEEFRRGEQGEYEFSTLVALYLPNFLYMSRVWVQNNLFKIFDQSNYQKWVCGMQGYARVNSVYEDIYSYLKNNGHFKKALDDGNLNDQVKEKVIQNIIVSYINGNESLDENNSLVSLLLERKQFRELQHLVWFMGTLPGADQPSLPAKVFELWPRMLQLIDIKSKEGRKLSSSLCHWMTFINEISDTNLKWILVIAPYAEEGHNSYVLLENLARISSAQPLEAQRIWLAMLSSFSYDYPEESIRKILTDLVFHNDEGERLANEVIDAYIKHGIDRPSIWLKEIKKGRPNV